MKKVRIKDGKIWFDCSAPDCATPGVPHSLDLVDFLAMLRSLYEEFSVVEDPRLEALTIAWVVFMEKFDLDPKMIDSKEVVERFDEMVADLTKQHEDLREEVQDILDKKFPSGFGGGGNKPPGSGGYLN